MTTTPAPSAIPAGRPKKAILIKNATLVDPCEETMAESAQDILILDDSIAAVQPGLDRLAREHHAQVIDGRRWLALPGLVNAHYHSHDVLLKGRFDVMSLEKWAFRALPRFFPPRSDQELRLRTLIGAAECLRSGITTVQDMLSLWPLTAHQARVVRQAYLDSGLRVVLGIQMADVGPLDTIPFFAQGLDETTRELAKGPAAPADMPDPMAELHGILRDSPAGQGDLLTWAVCPSSPERCSSELLTTMRDVALEHGLRLFSHIAISRLEAVAAQQIFAQWGGSPVRYLQAMEVLGPHLTLAHGVWLNADDRRILAETGTRMVLNPMSNLKTRNGIAQFQSYRQDGIPFGLGCDNCSCSDAQNMFQAMKFATLLSGVNSSMDNGLTAREAIHAATMGGARALGMEDRIGRIWPGYRADITFIDKDDLVYKPLNDLKRQLVYGEGGRGVDSVMVAGRFLVREGRLQGIDQAALEAELLSLMPALQRDADAAEARARALDDVIAQVEQRCMAMPVGMQRMACDAAEPDACRINR